jgi:hypothetical protein
MTTVSFGTLKDILLLYNNNKLLKFVTIHPVMYKIT